MNKQYFKPNIMIDTASGKQLDSDRYKTFSGAVSSGVVPSRITSTGAASIYQYVLILMFICACSSNQGADGLIHPDPAQIPGPDELNFVVDLKNPDDRLIQSMFEYEADRVVHTVGSEDHTDVSFLYNMRQLRLGPDGNIYAAKGSFHTIYVFDIEGTFKYAIGSMGSGPAEFSRIINFDFDSSFQHLYVLDEKKIEVFSLVDGQFEYDHTIQHELLFAHDLCALDDHVYVSGYYLEDLDTAQHVQRPFGDATNSKPIHKYSRLSDSRISSFGPSYKSYAHNPIWGGLLSEMMLTCNKRTATVVGLQKNFAHLYGYDQSGLLKWISRMDELDYQVFSEFDIITPDERLVSSKGGDVFSPIYRTFMDTDSEYAVLQINYAVSGMERPKIGDLIRMFFSDRPLFYSIYIDTGTGELFVSQVYYSDVEKPEHFEIFAARNAGRILTTITRETGIRNHQIISVYDEVKR